ncbi:hypothetical protein NBRC116188_09340 [Oceaniserpentilla sp. 4NH20-0058]|uniref:hypothetical protein n=1 Tax=Oceaniserpentilla sp. 4NH20-0058 TaxID=3127660 RepID=UPI003106186F
MASADIDYTRNLKEFEKLVARNRWQVNNLPKWWPKVKRKPIIISEGDSWFDFPVKSLTDVLGVFLRYTIGLQKFGMDSKTNVIDFLSRDKTLDGIFLRLERSGDHAKELAAKQPDKRNGVWEKKFPSQTLYTALQNKTARKHVDCIAISAGGNDLVDGVRHGVLQAYTGDWKTSYDHDLLTQTAREIIDQYIIALEYRDEFSPQAHVVTHVYSYAIQLSSGTSTQFDFSDVGFLIKELLGFLKLDIIIKPLKSIGIDITDPGEYTLTSEANLHETFDELGWPANPMNDDGSKSPVGVNQERAEFIKAMLDAFFEQMQNLPNLYKEKTGKPLQKFHCIDLRQEVQDPKYWADFIHLNGDGYREISEIFSKKIRELI